jgi:hypothetical protein
MKIRQLSQALRTMWRRFRFFEWRTVAGVKELEPPMQRCAGGLAKCRFGTIDRRNGKRTPVGDRPCHVCDIYNGVTLDADYYIGGARADA